MTHDIGASVKSWLVWLRRRWQRRQRPVDPWLRAFRRWDGQ